MVNNISILQGSFQIPSDHVPLDLALTQFYTQTDITYDSSSTNQS